MSGKVFQQELDGDGVRPGGVFIIQMLFKEPVAMPGREVMAEAIERHVGKVEVFCHDEKTAGFAAQEHVAQFKDGAMPVQLMVMGCTGFDGGKVNDFERSQMWDCPDRDRVLEECRYQVVAVDMLAGGLPPQERALLDMDFFDALIELYPTCEAFYFNSCGKLFTADDVREYKFTGLNRFIHFGVNVRFFTIPGTEDMMIDTVGMANLYMPDLQYHFHGMDPNWVVNHAYNMASYILENNNPIKSGETIDGMRDGKITQDIQWVCKYEGALIQPVREVIDVNMGRYASGKRPE